MATIGIDLGTTNSVVAFMEGGAPQVIPSPEGHKTTPSTVYYASADEIVVGEIAKRQLVVQPARTVRSVKRLMGRRFSQSEEVRQTLNYRVFASQEDSILIDVECKTILPEEVSAEILMRLRSTAEEFLGETVDGAVITVPAYFNDNQRQATKRAAALSGLNVLRIINEPTAAALAFGLNSNKSSTVAVFDFGGGTFDFSILTLEKDVFEVVSTNGNTFLGGDNIDEVLVKWILEEINSEHGVDISEDAQACQRVREAAEKCKCELSTLRSTSVNLPFIAADTAGPKHFQRDITREKFEELTLDLLNQLLPPCRQALNDANLRPDQIDTVLLVGGSTRIPAVQRIVTEFFGKPPSKAINPDEAVALGAAIQAGIITGDIEEVLLLDVTPLSLGVELEGGVFSPIIARNSSIPVTAMKKYTTVTDNQTTVKVHVLQGERKVARENQSLALFRLTDIEPAPREVPEIEVKFHLDANGILNVTATDLTSGLSKEIAVESYQHILAEDIEKAIQDAAERSQEDKIFVSRAHQRVKSQRIFNSITSFLEEHPDKVSEPEQRAVKESLIRLDVAIEKGNDELALEQEAILMAFCDKFGIENTLGMGRF